MINIRRSIINNDVGEVESVARSEGQINNL